MRPPYIALIASCVIHTVLEWGLCLRIHYLQHVPKETPGSILIWAEENEHAVTHSLLHEGDPLPEAKDFDWLIIMGGSMGVHDSDLFPWLAAEKRLIEQAIEAGKVILGFCLGGQIIADVIGGTVTRNAFPEIGWHPVEWTCQTSSDPLFSIFPRTTIVFQWHFDTFSELPPEARLLATSEACRNQAFVYRDKVFGFQFHLESTEETVSDMLDDLPAGLGPGPWVQSAEEIAAHPEHIAQNERWLREFLDRLALRN